MSGSESRSGKEKHAVSTVRELKQSLSKCNDDEERTMDILKQLEACPMTVSILQETLVGTVVSKLKSSEQPAVAAQARALVKQWKRVAKSSAAVATSSSSKSAVTASPLQSTEDDDAAAVEAEWGDLPPLRRNISCKFREVLLLSCPSLLKEGYSGDALSPLCLSRASEMETALAKAFPNDRKGYTDKARSLSFNLKRNGALRSSVLLGQTASTALIHMSSEDLAPADKAKERNEQVKDLQDSRRLDWEQANEDKINEMCGIHGDLLQASLFTCGRCKSIKTTSTQKQTRSADEPMTVFVFCINCGNRWKC